MLKSAFAGLFAAFCLAALSGVAAYAGGKVSREPAPFRDPLSRDQKILQALNRLTFGPRPGDVQMVRAMGLKKWIDMQLHPARIPDSPVLESKLKPLDTLAMNTGELVQNYPTPQTVRLMVNGQMAFPSDPDRRMMIEKLAVRLERAKGRKAFDDQEGPMLAGLLAPADARALRTGPPAERLATFEALNREKQDEVIEALPGGLKQQLFNIAPPELRRRIEMSFGPQQVVVRDLMEGKLLRAIYSNRQLGELLTDFWFNHFNVFLNKGADLYLVTEYERDVIRPHVLGKFRDLLEATAKSPAMLFYLDNWQSVAPQGLPGRANPAARRGLNENYGRELLELHTLGVDGGYTQKDVTEVARCFTGWTIRQPQRGGGFMFNPRMHDAGQKLVLGVTIPAGGGIEDGEKVLDILARSPATAHHISVELAQRFVADVPPEPLVDHMARTFLKTDGDLREVMKTMLRSKEFWSVGAYRSKMKSPLEMVVSAVRAENGDVDYAFNLANQVALLGEPLYRKLEPTGYSNSGRQWINSAGLLARMNFALQLAGNRVPGVRVAAQAAGTDGRAAIALGSPDFQEH